MFFSKNKPFFISTGENTTDQNLENIEDINSLVKH